jgi:hypothetical protein
VVGSGWVGHGRVRLLKGEKMKVNVVATGTRPLLMHNIQLASPLNSYAKNIKAISSKRTKTEDDREAMSKLEFMGSLYFDEIMGPYLPGNMIFASLNEGAKITKSGRKVERGVDVVELVNPLVYQGPRDMEALFNDPNFVDIRPVRIGGSRVDRTRPIFRQWEVEFDLIIDPDILNEDEVVRIITDAGSFAGFGDYRKMYGRYSADIQIS